MMSTEDSPANRRTWSRHAVDIEARLRVPSEKIMRGTLENLGRGGAFFVTDNLETNVVAADPVDVMMTLGGAEVALRGVVLRLETFFSGTEVLRALAVRFDTPLPEDAPIGSA